jgi:SAM-dependent methyltransferase
MHTQKSSFGNRGRCRKLNDERKIKKMDFGDFRRKAPLSTDYGFDRGTPVDRYYIEKFLEDNKADIRGRVLEIKDRMYTERFGGSKVDYSDILDVDRSNTLATIYADLRVSHALPQARYDCIIVTQTLHVIDDYDMAIRNLYKMLKKNGVLLCTLPSVSRIDGDCGEEGDFWRFTKASARYIFKKNFADHKLQVITFGNVFTNICFLEGLSVEELERADFEYCDKYFPLIVGVRAKK